MITIRWHGRGGQGAFTAAKILGNAAMLDKKYALSFPSFGPERRGAPIQAYTKIDDHKIADRSALSKADYILYLDETLYTEQVLQDLNENGLLFINTKSPEQYGGTKNIVAVNVDKISEELLKRPVSNTAMLALLAAQTGIVEIESVKRALSDFLPPKIASKNEAVIDEVVKVVQGNA